MKRNTLNFWIDLISLLVMFAIILTGFLIYYVLPPGCGSGGGKALTLWGMNRHEFGDIHFYLAVALIILMVLHVAIHWSWICTTLNKLLGVNSVSRGRDWYGVGFLIILIILIIGSLYWAKTQVQVAEGYDRGLNYQEHGRDTDEH